MASFPRLTVLGLVAALATACDRTPTGPEVDDVAALLAISNPAAANSRIFNNTLPALFRESVARVQARHGRAGVELLLADWRDLQEKLKKEAPTASRSAVQARLAAIHEAELRIVRRVLGIDAIHRVIREAGMALAEANLQIAAAADRGEDMASPQSVAREAATGLEAARRAISQADSRSALEAASQAATLVAGLRYYLLEARRIHGLETLLPQAIEKLSAGRPTIPAAITRLDALDARTRAALAAGQRSESHALLAQLRAEQIALVIRALGTDRIALLIRQVDERAREIAPGIDSAKPTDRDAIRVERMVHEAQDMSARARAALANGDAATALDLASHAAGLLNAAQHLTWQ